MDKKHDVHSRYINSARSLVPFAHRAVPAERFWLLGGRGVAATTAYAEHTIAMFCNWFASEDLWEHTSQGFLLLLDNIIGYVILLLDNLIGYMILLLDNLIGYMMSSMYMLGAVGIPDCRLYKNMLG